GVGAARPDRAVRGVSKGRGLDGAGAGGGGGGGDSGGGARGGRGGGEPGEDAGGEEGAGGSVCRRRTVTDGGGQRRTEADWGGLRRTTAVALAALLVAETAVGQRRSVNVLQYRFTITLPDTGSTLKGLAIML